MMGLTAEQVGALLAKPAQGTALPRVPQNGPLRYVDDEFRCASKGCGSSTYLKVEGVPYCGTHSLRKLNELVIQLSGE